MIFLLKMLYFRTLLINIGAHYEKFPVVYDLDPSSPHYKSRIFEVGDQEQEITADQPIQVRINNGPWINVRQSDLNNK